MPPSTASPQLSDSLPHDEHIFRHVLEGWRTDFAHFIQYGVPRILVALVLAFIVLRIVLFFVKRMHGRADQMVGNTQRAAQLRTMAAILRATTYGVIGFYLITQVLSAIGVSLGPFIASAGVIGLGISFGAQSIFKDMLTGVFILIEDQYTVGDTIKIAPNSQITTVSNLSRDFSMGTLNVSVDARENPDRVMTVLKNVATEVRKDEAFKDVVLDDPNILGVDKISGFEVIYPITVRVMVNQRDGVMRELRRRILLAFAKEGVAFGASSSTLILQNPGTANPPKPIEPENSTR